MPVDRSNQSAYMMGVFADRFRPGMLPPSGAVFSNGFELAPVSQADLPVPPAFIEFPPPVVIEESIENIVVRILPQVPPPLPS